MPDETTIRINDGPAVPLSLANAAVDAIIDEKARRVMEIVDGAKPKTETRNLMCRLTDDEQRVRGVDLADAQKRLAELTEEKRAIGDRIKDTQTAIDKLAEAVKHRQEERPVTCSMHPDYKADTMTIRRTDTGEIVAVRQLTHQERQPELPGTEEK